MPVVAVDDRAETSGTTICRRTRDGVRAFAVSSVVVLALDHKRLRVPRQLCWLEL
jgi:hypothetical protein